MSGHYMKCDACDGSGSFTCLVCKGRKCRKCEPPFSGKEVCPVCLGKGYIWRDDNPKILPAYIYSYLLIYFILASNTDYHRMLEHVH
jgi:hypothetical protein